MSTNYGKYGSQGGYCGGSTKLSKASRGSRGLSELQKRTLVATLPRTPANRVAFETREKEAEEPDSEYVNPESSAGRSSISLITISEVLSLQSVLGIKHGIR